MGKKKTAEFSLSLSVPLPSLNSRSIAQRAMFFFSSFSHSEPRIKFYLRRRAAREREREKEIIRDARGLRRRLSRSNKKIGEKQERREICALSIRSYVNDTHLEAATRDRETPTECCVAANMLFVCVCVCVGVVCANILTKKYAKMN